MHLRSLLPTLAVLATFVACKSSTEPTPAQNQDEVVSPLSEMEMGGDSSGSFTENSGAPVNASATIPSQGGQLSQDSQRVQLRNQQQAFLTGEHIKRGDAALERADLATAQLEYAAALDTDPSNADARRKLRNVQALLGETNAVAAETLRNVVDAELVRRAQARMEAQDAAIMGDNALRSGDYDAAIEHYRSAQLILKWHPIIATEDLDERIITGKLNDAVDLAEEGRRAEKERQIAAAAEAEAAREADARNYRENKLRALYEQANQAFRQDRFATAEDLCVQILNEDPENEDAAELREIAQEARHRDARETTRRDYREQWERTFEEMSSMALPQTESIVFNDLERWSEVLERAPSEFASLASADNAERNAVMDRLKGVSITPNFGGPDEEGTPLSDIAAYLQNVTGVNFVISTLATELDEEETNITLQLGERTVYKTLEIIAGRGGMSENLRWKIQNGVVKFVTAEELTGGQVLHMYEVRDIIHPVRDFPGGDVNIAPSGGLEPPEEDLEEREANVVTSDALDTLIRNNISPESWDADPANSLRITESGTMVVYQTPEVHEQIRKLLRDLREATGIMVDIQARFLTVEDNFLEDIGVDFRGLGQPGLGTNTFFNDFGDATAQGDLGAEIGQGTDLGAFLDEGEDGDLRARVESLYDTTLGDPDVLEASGGLSFQWTYLNDLQLQMILRAVSKSERVELVTAPRILVFNTGRANLTVLNQVAYVSDFNIEIAQGASIADPIIDVVQDGAILDVRPVVSADRRFITLELRPTIAQLTRPIRQAVTTLGSQNSVTIELPEVDIQRVRTSVPMPDGATVLLGGEKVSANQSQNSGVPILNQIPLVSFLFERKGNFVSNRKLLILLKAEIVIPEEHEPTAAQLGF